MQPSAAEGWRELMNQRSGLSVESLQHVMLMQRAAVIHPR